LDRNGEGVKWARDFVMELSLISLLKLEAENNDLLRDSGQIL
jgi:hypothetical protein